MLGTNMGSWLLLVFYLYRGRAFHSAGTGIARLLARNDIGENLRRSRGRWRGSEADDSLRVARGDGENRWGSKLRGSSCVLGLSADREGQQQNCRGGSCENS